MIRKPAIVTAASIAGVILAGGAAIGANVGILDAADNSPVGDLSAQAVVASDDTASQPTIATESGHRATQTFTVDTAGDVDLSVADTRLTISEVRANPGWTWSDSPSSDGTIRILFTSGSDSLEFVATANPDGTIGARVDRLPTDQLSPTPSDDSRYDDDRYDDDRYEHDDDHEYEGRDDDHEYEGRDDDD